MDCIAIRIGPTDQGGYVFTAAIALPKAWGLPTEARIYVEAYAKSSTQRFDFGTVGNPSRPTSTELTELDSANSILFRVKVVDTSLAIGRILASALGIRPQSDTDGDDRKPLLPVQERNLGEMLWTLDLPTDSGPVLVLNNRVADITGRLKADPVLRAAILPEVMRQTVMHVFANGNEGDEWADDWKGLVRSVLGRDFDQDSLSTAPALDDAGESELSEIVSRFCEQQSFASIMLAHAGEAHAS